MAMFVEETFFVGRMVRRRLQVDARRQGIVGQESSAKLSGSRVSDKAVGKVQI